MHDYGYFSVFIERMPDLLDKLYEHLIIVVIAIILGCIVAIPLGVYLAKTSIRWIRSLIFNIVNIFQTIPSLALLAMIAPLLGYNFKTAVVALFLYSLMPILKNTFAGFDSIDEEIIESANGMGFGSMERIIKVELPLALPYIMSGVRITTVYIISWAVLAGLIGAGGLGELILAALSLNDNPLVIAAAVMAMVLALISDFVLRLIEKLSTRRGQTAKQ